MTTHIMLDLETWGRTPGSDIRSIGAVVFDPVASEVSLVCETCKDGQGNISTYSGDCSDCLNTRLQSGYGATFYVACDNPIITPDGDFPFWTRFEYSLQREPETVKWWSEQSPEAQAAFENPVDLFHALNSFNLFLKDAAAGTMVDELRIWANDPQFDVSILEAAYRAVGLPHPWHYRAPRSFRTVVELSGMTRDDMQQFNTGTTHNALDDAISQAKIVCEAYKRLGLNSSTQAGDKRPENCRNRLKDQGKPYPKSGCYHCKDGGLRGCPFEGNRK